MSAGTSPAQPDRPGRERAWHWRSAPFLDCAGFHGADSGRLDESARRLSHAEYRAAQQLVGEGHRVVAVAETPGRGRQADLQACGVPVEVKSWLSLGSGRDRAPGPRSVVNKLLQAAGQASAVVLEARGSGLSARAAREGMLDYAWRDGTGGVRSVRVIGDGFDLAWSRPPVPSTERRAGRERDVRPSL